MTQLEKTYNNVKDFYQQVNEKGTVNIQEVKNLLQQVKETPTFWDIDEELAKKYGCTSMNEVEENGLLSYEEVKELDKLYKINEIMVDLEEHLTNMVEQLSKVEWFSGVL